MLLHSPPRPKIDPRGQPGLASRAAAAPAEYDSTRGTPKADARAIDTPAGQGIPAPMAQLGQLADITHELRTPLTAISGALALLGSGAMGALPAKAAGLIAIARDNSERMRRLIDDILTAAALSAGQSAMRWERVDLTQFLPDAIAANTGLRAGQPGCFRLVLPAQPAWVRADRARLQQVLANLLSNAAKYSPATAPVAVTLHSDAETHRITVSDQGPGIPASFRSQIFQRFARADETAAAIQGTGLGLCIAREIVQHHGGAIHFESQIGVGTSFHIDLPAVTIPAE